MWYRRLDMNGKVLEETQPGLNSVDTVPFPRTVLRLRDGAGVQSIPLLRP